MPRTMRIPRPVLLIGVITLAIFSLSTLSEHPYNPLRFNPSLTSPDESSPNVVPPVFHDATEERPVEPHPPSHPVNPNPPSHPVEPNPPSQPEIPPLHRRENATLLMLTSDREIDDALRVVGQVEDRFNRKFNYPWIFLNDRPFSKEFERRMSSIVSGPVHFAQIPDELWNHPPYLNWTKATERMEQMENDGIAKSGRIGYHNMCRFFSGQFYHHPLLQNYRYYWRVEPEAHYHCDVNFDPFAFMRENKKKYGFVLSMPEDSRTIESLWPTVKEFIAQHPQYLAPNNAMDFLSDNGGIDYNDCYFFNNFEIADMNLWRGEAYSAFFDYLDRSGGFYYERWGDAPVHTIAAALLADKDEVHFFEEIGYEHYPFVHCPQGEMWERGRCSCEQERNFDYHMGWSCLPKWDQVKDIRQEL